MSFDYLLRGAFGYEFTRWFGDSESEATASRVRVHTMILSSRGGDALDSAVAFSFPLCGTTVDDWTAETAMRFLRAQVIEFSHHMGDLEVTDNLSRFWKLAKFSFLATSQGMEERHMVVHLFVDTRVRPGYVFVHEDEMQQDAALVVAQRMWTLLRCIMIERLSAWRGRLDSDYSPSKGASKLARYTAAAASLFSRSP